jgi:PIN domain nuclease of toxin-antitoxin system
VKLLLDTHAFLWWLTDDPKLKEAARSALSDSAAGVYVSAASIWEIAIKAKLGKLDLRDIDPVEEIAANDFVELPMSARHAHAAGYLPRHHDDPFDRMLIAQAQVENMILVSHDTKFEAYGVKLLSI